MTAFIVIGALGLVLVVGSLLLDDLVEGLFESLDFDAGGILSGPVIGAFLTSFGFGGALTMGATGAGVGLGIAGGLAAGLVIGAITTLLVRSVMRMPTDRTPRTTDLVGAEATVLTPIPAGGLGEVTTRYLGQLTKLSARSDRAIAAGTRVVVTAVTSSTSVVVTPLEVEGGFPALEDRPS